MTLGSSVGPAAGVFAGLIKSLARVAQRLAAQADSVNHAPRNVPDSLCLNLLPALVTAGDNSVYLDWWTELPPQETCWVYVSERRTGPVRLGMAQQVPPGHLVFCDSSAPTTRERYYDLSVVRGGRELRSGRTWISAPLRPGILALKPNPVSQGAVLAMGAPFTSGTSILTIHDVAGRLLRAQHFSRTRRLTLDFTGWPPGVYLLTVCQGEHSATLRVIVL